MSGELTEGDARARTLFDAAFDAVVRMDAAGRIVEVNAVAEQIFGWRAEQMVGQDLAELLIPPGLRDLHRRGLAKYLATGATRMVNHPTEEMALRADGAEFPVELAIRRLDVPAPPAPPMFIGFVRDITERRRTERELRDLAAEQAALHRVAALVASAGAMTEIVTAVTQEVGGLLGAQTANTIRFGGDGSATVVGRWNAEGVDSVPIGESVRLEGDTTASRIYRTGRPARLDDYAEADGELAELLRRLGYIDFDQDGLSDVWERIYGLDASAADGDEDNDGLTNRQESALGTDPRDPGSAFPLQLEPGDEPGTFQLQLDTGFGKQYQIESSDDFATWSDFGGIITGTGATIEVPIPASDQSTGIVIYRGRLIGDVDEDDDGLTAWEEHQLGTSDSNAETAMGMECPMPGNSCIDWTRR